MQRLASTHAPSSGIFAKLIATLLLGCALYWAFYFPVLSITLILGLFAYFCLLLVSPLLCFIVLPAAIPLLDLAPWSGRLLFDEFDLLMITTFAGLLWSGTYKLNTLRINKWTTIALIALSSIYLVSFLVGLFPLDPLDFNAIANYYSSYNSMRIGKGFLYALLFIPAIATFANHDLQRTHLTFLTGICISLIFVGLSVLWERGVIGEMLQANSIYQWVDSLFDFSTRYRATALLSQMHTGGEAIDEFIALTWPFSLAGLFIFRKPAALILSAVALVLALYTLTSTFSRATYLAGGAGAASLLLVPFYAKSVSIKLWLKLVYLSVFILSVGTFIYAYAKGGMWALYASVALFVIGAFTGMFRQHKPALLYISLATCAVVTFLLYHGFASSKWNENSVFSSLISTAIISSLIFSMSISAGKSAQGGQQRPFILLVLILAVVSAAGIPSTIGERMDTRFSEVNRDLQMRQDHWQDIHRSMDDGIITAFFGMGLGTFPKHYLWSTTNIEEIGSYLFQSELYNNYLSLGGGSFLFLGQKIRFQPDHHYKLTLMVRNRLNTGRFVARVCHRHILEPAQSNTQCLEVTELIPPTGEKWRALQFDVHADDIGVKAWYQGKPTTFGLYFSGKNTQLDIDEVVLEDELGFNILRNGSFEQGGDHWLSYNDIDHLPWHIKNLWLNLYYEFGALGLAIVAMVLMLALFQLIRCTRVGDRFAPAFIASLVGFLTVGLFGSFDVPRNIWLFYMMIFIAFVYQSNCVQPIPARRKADTLDSTTAAKET